MALRVEDEGKSEGPRVIRGIPVEPSNITGRENGLTSLRSFITRELG
jgi:hypothetical protein